MSVWVGKKRGMSVIECKKGDFKFQISNFKFQISNLRFQISNFKLNKVVL
jgi:hypothetical protein